MPTGPIHPVALAPRRAASFDPGAALAALDDQDGQDARRGLGPSSEAASAWDAAWIACLTNSPRWAETARLEFARVTGGTG